MIDPTQSSEAAGADGAAVNWYDHGRGPRVEIDLVGECWVIDADRARWLHRELGRVLGEVESAEGKLRSERLASGWVCCCRCEAPQQVLHPSTCTGASEVEPGFFVCNNGRDCSLRLKRRRRMTKP